MNRRHRETTPLAEQAAKWLHDIGKGGHQQQAAFAAWLKESPRHIAEVLCAAAVDKALERLEAGQWPDVTEFLSNPSGTIIPFDEELPKPPKRTGARLPWIAGALAATVTLLAIGSLWFYELTGWHEYTTAVGEQRTLTLDDGSLAYLNTRSRLEVRFTNKAREVKLLDGEALFRVEHDPERPFSVSTNDAVIRAIGTQFDVYQRSHATVVSVVEGLVEIANSQGSPRLGTGDEAQISSGEVTRVQKVDVARTAAWRQRRLVFDLDPLSEVAHQFNRYNRTPHIRVDDAAARAKRFSGVFDVDDPHSLMNLLATYGDLTVQERDGEIVIRSRTGVGSAE